MLLAKADGILHGFAVVSWWGSFALSRMLRERLSYKALAKYQGLLGRWENFSILRLKNREERNPSRELRMHRT
jgi:hypothetical protein